MKTVVCLMLGAVLATQLASQLACAEPNSDQLEWESYKLRFGKRYDDPQEDAERRAIFIARKKTIDAHNKGHHSYTKGLNEFTDWYDHERSKLGMQIPFPEEEHTASEIIGPEDQQDEFMRKIMESNVTLPREFDWRNEPNRVGPVKDQGECRSCWAFATTGLLEGQQVARGFTEELVPLSEQMLLECTLRYCGGGWVEIGLDIIKESGGIPSSASYPYVAFNAGVCHLNETNVMTTKGFQIVPPDAIKSVLVSYGPVSVAYRVEKEFHDYRGGVYATACKLPDITVFDPESDIHVVLIVGYGNDTDHDHFWIVKNSWGESWGEEGYFKITDVCGITSKAVIARF